MGRQVTLTVDEDDLRAVIARSNLYDPGNLHEARRLVEAIPPKERRPTEAAVTAFCMALGRKTGLTLHRFEATKSILALHAAMPGGVPDEWLKSDE